MPRTSRHTASSGLAWHAVGPLLRWPLHSPRRLGALLALLVALVWLATLLRPAAAESAVDSAATSTTAATMTTATRVVTPTGTATSTSTSTFAVGFSPVEVAVGFVTRWARPDLPAQVWADQLTPWATPMFGAQLRTVLPANVPATRVSGPAATVQVSDVTAVVTVPTDAGTVRVDLAAGSGVNGAWLVSAVTPTDTPVPGGPGAGSTLAATYTPLLPAGG